MNVSDSEVVRAILVAGGYCESASAGAADVVLLNTCAIREKAEAKVWTRLRDLRGVKPHGVKRRDGKKPRRQQIAVLGCMVREAAPSSPSRARTRRRRRRRRCWQCRASRSRRPSA